MQAWRKFKARCLHVHSRLTDISGCTSRLRSIHLGWTVRCGGLEANDRSGLETWDPVPVCRKAEFALCFPEHHRSLSGERYLHLQSWANVSLNEYTRRKFFGAWLGGVDRVDPKPTHAVLHRKVWRMVAWLHQSSRHFHNLQMLMPTWKLDSRTTSGGCYPEKTGESWASTWKLVGPFRVIETMYIYNIDNLDI